MRGYDLMHARIEGEWDILMVGLVDYPLGG